MHPQPMLCRLGHIDEEQTHFFKVDFCLWEIYGQLLYVCDSLISEKQKPIHSPTFTAYFIHNTHGVPGYY